MSTETELQAAVKTSAKKDSRKKGKADLALFVRPLFWVMIRLTLERYENITLQQVSLLW